MANSVGWSCGDFNPDAGTVHVLKIEDGNGAPYHPDARRGGLLRATDGWATPDAPMFGRVEADKQNQRMHDACKNARIEPAVNFHAAAPHLGESLGHGRNAAERRREEPRSCRAPRWSRSTTGISPRPMWSIRFGSLLPNSARSRGTSSQSARPSPLRLPFSPSSMPALASVFARRLPLGANSPVSFLPVEGAFLMAAPVSDSRSTSPLQ